MLENRLVQFFQGGGGTVHACTLYIPFHWQTNFLNHGNPIYYVTVATTAPRGDVSDANI